MALWSVSVRYGVLRTFQCSSAVWFGVAYSGRHTIIPSDNLGGWEMGANNESTIGEDQLLDGSLSGVG